LTAAPASSMMVPIPMGLDRDEASSQPDSAQRDTLTALDPPASDRAEDLLLIVMSGNDVGRIHPIDPRRVLTILGREDAADVRVHDAEISRRHAGIRYDAARGRYVIADLKSRNGTSVNDERIHGEHPLAIGDKIRLGRSTVLRVTLASEPEADYARRMQQVALRDGLTGAYNRRYLDERLVAEVAFARRHAANLSLLLIDIDHFKSINDQHGHQGGDMVLKSFHELVQTAVRAEDTLGRYGGEEFAIVCRESEQDATVIAERLRQCVESTSFAHEERAIRVTVSIGIAGVREQGIEEPAALVRAADAALYRAKQSGRNRCCRASDGTP
jgi:diguanylate cyclase (GGDEF)-like protein